MLNKLHVQPADKEMRVKEELTKNERLQYLAAVKSNEIQIQYCNILSAGKVYEYKEQILVNPKNRGRSWKADSTVQNMFLLIEKLFRKEPNVFVTKIDEKQL